MLHWVRLLAIEDYRNESEMVLWVDEDGISWGQGSHSRAEEGIKFIIGPKIPSWKKLEELPQSIKTYGLTCKTMELTRMAAESLNNKPLVDKANSAEQKVLAAVLEGL